MAIFLSYSRKDEQAVKALAEGFDVARRQVWFDHDLGGGDAWWDQILANIRSSSVFVFALSDDSLASKACVAEFEYAKELHRPIVPVQVGHVGGMRTHLMASLHVVTYRPNEANSGFEVLAAVDAAAGRAGPLPDPLPAEPPIPYAYLQAIRRQIESAELDPAHQDGVIEQLRKALGEETEETVRQEILAMLRSLLTKPWVTRRSGRNAKALLIANSPEQDEQDEQDDIGETQLIKENAGSDEEPPTVPWRTREPSPSRAPAPDGREIFDQRMKTILEKQQEEERRQAEDAIRASRDGPSAPGDYWAGVAGSSAAGGSGQRGADQGSAGQGGADGDPGGVWPGVSAAASHEPPPVQENLAQNHEQQTQLISSHGQQRTQPQPAQPQPAVPQSQVPPPNHWALSIVAFLLSLLFGGIAMYFSYQVGQRYQAQDYDGAVRASRNAKVWAIVGIVVGGLVLAASLSAASV